MIDGDPGLWLEDLHGEEALAWVRERNAETAERLTTAPGFAALAAELREVLDDEGRIPYVRRRGKHLYNFWQDAAHVRGVWRRTGLEEYRRDRPAWETVLDLDALAAAEGEDWVWAGAEVLRPGHRHALVLLSRAGSDAVTVREFDLEALRFVEDGFQVAEAKTSIGWIDADHVYIGADLGPRSLTASGYPRTVRRWRRGTPLADAELVFEAAPEDLSASGWCDPSEDYRRHFVSLQRDFWHRELFLLADGDRPVKVDVPDDAEKYVHRQWLMVVPKTPWAGHPAGSLLAFDFESYLGGEREPAAVLFTPDGATALAGHFWTRNHLIVKSLHHVTTRIEVLTPADGPWTRRPLAEVPALATATVHATDPHESDEYFLDVSGFVQPPTLFRGEAGGATEVVKRASALFDTEGLSVRQHFATSADGTRVPFFVVGPDRDAPGPTLLYGYGGFEVTLTPGYDAVTGRAWLARGGTYVVAGIRGGGEYGPGWHHAALKADRERAFEDFAAVARHLVDLKITTPGLLGIEGRSNGGLLMGAVTVRYPHLFGAVVIGFPLLDLMRFHLLLAGASWTAEYGNPEDPADRPHLEALSPYHGFRADRAYPPILIVTATSDDRVHPGHARKAAARLKELGHRVLFHETTAGGHAGSADNEQAARVEALTHTFLWHHLRGEA
ncbi:S9 family peptidase [Streptomyces sp. ISL-66]|uniref:prolyl oligopeptidase family serine peptidase n=1 Tax=Streptomyces sp. ISL-66 TaxID=2819186 RepID=UPI001BEAB5F4|nr:prolyl oligopeptidase family serine peptidase [Streptomyces sp. ISL-66]MBT2471734.1 S9 family peptidase [Streptomyces sp. ISL-66]